MGYKNYIKLTSFVNVKTKMSVYDLLGLKFNNQLIEVSTDYFNPQPDGLILIPNLVADMQRPVEVILPQNCLFDMNATDSNYLFPDMMDNFRLQYHDAILHIDSIVGIRNWSIRFGLIRYDD